MELPQRLKDTIHIHEKKHYDIPFNLKDVLIGWSSIGSVDVDTAEAYANEILAKVVIARRLKEEHGLR